MRRGAIPDLSIEDYKKVTYKSTEGWEVSIGTLLIYKGSSEEYVCFISPEACIALDAYLEKRQRDGEKFSPNSALIRTHYGEPIPGEVQSSTIENPSRVSTDVINRMYQRAWRSSGIRPQNPKVRKMFPFKQIHGFRKFFKSNRLACPEHGQMDIEIDLGHIAPYYKPSFEHRLEQYVRTLTTLAIEEVTEDQTEFSRGTFEDGDKV